MRDKFCELNPDQAQKTCVVYNGVNLHKYNPDYQKTYRLDLGMLCSFNPRKGIYQIVLLIHKLKKLGFNPHLHIAGGRLHGPDFDEYYVSILQLIEKLDLTGNITIYGHVNNPGEWFNKIDIYISNSYWEGQQVSLLESLAAGCYSLSHCWKGAEEILPEDNIFIGDDELEEKIIAYHQKSDDAKRNMRKQMREIAEQKFDIETTKAKILGIIKEFC
jgi:glycosyltransferase involved in cell wall biosynthesis